MIIFRILKADEIMALSFINEYEMLEDNFRILKDMEYQKHSW